MNQTSFSDYKLTESSQLIQMNKQEKNSKYPSVEIQNIKFFTPELTVDQKTINMDTSTADSLQDKKVYTS